MPFMSYKDFMKEKYYNTFHFYFVCHIIIDVEGY